MATKTSAFLIELTRILRKKMTRCVENVAETCKDKEKLHYGEQRSKPHAFYERISACTACLS